MTRYTGEEFVKALTSERGIPSSGAPLHLVGMVKASVGGETDSVLFAPGGSCASWTPVPVKMIQSVEHLGKVPCRDHEHDHVRLHVKPPTTDEGRVLAAVLRQIETAGMRTDVGEDTQERWRPRWRPPQLPPINIPNPIQNVRCAQCIAANIALGLAVAAAVAALGPAIGAATAVSSLMAQFGISEALAIAAVGGASGATMAHMMCQGVC